MHCLPSFRRIRVAPGKQLLRTCLVIGTIAALSPKLQAEITFELPEESIFDSLTIELVMSVYADDPWGSDEASQVNVDESFPEFDFRETLYQKHLSNWYGTTHFDYLAIANNVGVFAPEHWPSEWHIPYRSGAVAQVYGTLYPDGSGRLITNTYTRADRGGNFFPNSPGVAQLNGNFTLNGSPGEGNLKVANFDWVQVPSPPRAIAR